VAAIVLIQMPAVKSSSNFVSISRLAIYFCALVVHPAAALWPVSFLKVCHKTLSFLHLHTSSRDYQEKARDQLLFPRWRRVAKHGFDPSELVLLLSMGQISVLLKSNVDVASFVKLNTDTAGLLDCSVKRVGIWGSNLNNSLGNCTVRPTTPARNIRVLSMIHYYLKNFILKPRLQHPFIRSLAKIRDPVPRTFTWDDFDSSQLNQCSVRIAGLSQLVKRANSSSMLAIKYDSMVTWAQPLWQCAVNVRTGERENGEYDDNDVNDDDDECSLWPLQLAQITVVRLVFKVRNSCSITPLLLQFWLAANQKPHAGKEFLKLLLNHSIVSVRHTCRACLARTYIHAS